jgi:hypothetical protein
MVGNAGFGNTEFVGNVTSSKVSLLQYFQDLSSGRIIQGFE